LSAKKSGWFAIRIFCAWKMGSQDVADAVNRINPFDKPVLSMVEGLRTGKVS